jgi:Fic-DOC domain mobile mystery protein B
VSDFHEEPDAAATPLTEEEKRELRLSYISTRAELNAAEQENIARGQEWAMRSRHDILTERFVKDLHRHMLRDVWRWAGHLRTSARNIGIDYWEIPVALRVLLDDTRAWLERKTYSPDETAVRFHHRLTQIHPFPNGNGRHGRMIADLLVIRLGGDRFSWGRSNLRDPGAIRTNYIEALHSADNYDIGALLAFARS